jgi:hypothetical protein
LALCTCISSSPHVRSAELCIVERLSEHGHSKAWLVSTSLCPLTDEVVPVGRSMRMRRGCTTIHPHLTLASKHADLTAPHIEGEARRKRGTENPYAIRNMHLHGPYAICTRRRFSSTTVPCDALLFFSKLGRCALSEETRCTLCLHKRWQRRVFSKDCEAQMRLSPQVSTFVRNCKFIVFLSAMPTESTTVDEGTSPLM